MVINGDFNSGYCHKEGMHGDMSAWAHLHGLYSKSAVARFVTKTRDCSTVVDGSHLDHICLSGSMLAGTLSNVTDGQISLVYDHLPLYQDISYQISPLITSRTSQHIAAYDVPIRNERLVQVYQDVFDRTVHHALSTGRNPTHEGRDVRASMHRAAETVEILQRHMVTTASLLAPEPQRHGLSLWSPAMMANWYHFQFLKTLLLRTRFAQGATLQTLLTQLAARIATLNRPKDPNAVTITIHSLAVDEFHVRDWSSLPLHQWASLIPRQLKEVKKRLSFKSRQFQYFQLSKFRKRHEQRRVNREYKKLFKSL